MANAVKDTKGRKATAKSSGKRSGGGARRPATAKATISKPKTSPSKKTSRSSKKRPATVTANVPVTLPETYRPSDDEPFMNDRQKIYFRNKLLSWKDEIIRQTRDTIAGLNSESTQHADLADRATSETDRALELRARDRQRKLVSKINAALARIEDGSYGYCEETGEPINLRRLDARPIATLSIEAQERHERRERVYRDD